MSVDRAFLRKCLEYRNQYYETRLPRVIRCLDRVLDFLNEENTESESLFTEAWKLFRRLLPDDRRGVDVNDLDDMVPYDQLVNLWSRRFTRRLNLTWHKYKGAYEKRPYLL